jgi:hypothetical protein
VSTHYILVGYTPDPDAGHLDHFGPYPTRALAQAAAAAQPRGEYLRVVGLEHLPHVPPYDRANPDAVAV